jgi:putative membrane protein
MANRVAADAAAKVAQDPFSVTPGRRRRLRSEGYPMELVAQILVGIVAAIHVYILVLEMFLWRTDRARAAFGTTEEFALQSATLAANQGLYNGFLAAGLVYGLISSTPAFEIFFLCCVIVAGIYGAITASRRILFVQVIPGALALVFVLAAR